MKFSFLFSWKEIVLLFKLFPNSLPSVQLTISQHWFRYWFGAKQGQAIIWSNDDLVSQCMFDSCGLDEVNAFKLMLHETHVYLFSIDTFNIMWYINQCGKYPWTLLQVPEDWCQRSSLIKIMTCHLSTTRPWTELTLDSLPICPPSRYCWMQCDQSTILKYKAIKYIWISSPHTIDYFNQTIVHLYKAVSTCKPDKLMDTEHEGSLTSLQDHQLTVICHSKRYLCGLNCQLTPTLCCDWHNEAPLAVSAMDGIDHRYAQTFKHVTARVFSSRMR